MGLSPPVFSDNQAHLESLRLRRACDPLCGGFCRIRWQGQRESNPQPSVLETDALPIELYPYAAIIETGRRAQPPTRHTNITQ
jgi:hypothetical protein